MFQSSWFFALKDRIIFTFINLFIVTNDTICKLMKLDSPDERSPYLTDLVIMTSFGHNLYQERTNPVRLVARANQIYNLAPNFFQLSCCSFSLTNKDQLMYRAESAWQDWRSQVSSELSFLGMELSSRHLLTRTIWRLYLHYLKIFVCLS
jgi:hypothetical protein